MQSKNDRISYLREHGVGSIIDQYLEEKLAHAFISIASLDDVPTIKMITKGCLQGWCWQSTEFLSVFFADSDLITRGNLNLSDDNPYDHAWIELQYLNHDYVLTLPFA